MSALLQPDSNDALSRLLAKAEEIPVLPHVVFRVLDVTGDADMQSSGLEHAIITDPGFSAKVLALANSNFYGLPKRMGSVREALQFLGFKSVRSLAMTIGAFDMFVGKNDGESLRRRAWWRHSVDTASCAKWLAKTTGKVPMDDAYTCGLLHYMGRNLLDRHGEGDYNRCEEAIQRGVPILTAEEQNFGCNHVEVSVGAARKWGFPESLAQGLRYLEEPLQDEEFKEERATTSLASSIARIAKNGRKQEEVSIPAWTLPLLGFGPDDSDTIIEEGIAEITAAQLNL